MSKVTFPKIGEKHNLNYHHTAADRFRFLPHEKPAKQVPKKIVIVFSHKLAETIAKRLRLSTTFKVHRSDMYVNAKGKIALVELGIGAPLIAICTEELLALGAKEFLILGVAGAISPKLEVGDTVLCTRAIRDEGTSHHYIRNSKYSYPDRGLTNSLYMAMKSNRMGFIKGTTWTNDAVYAQTNKEIARYSKEGVLTADMEAAALFAIAKRKGAKAAAVFSISDILHKAWTGIGFPENGYRNLSEVAELFSKA